MHQDSTYNKPSAILSRYGLIISFILISSFLYLFSFDGEFMLKIIFLNTKAKIVTTILATLICK